jgi:hypothetical protein
MGQGGHNFALSIMQRGAFPYPINDKNGVFTRLVKANDTYEFREMTFLCTEIITNLIK